MALKPLNSIEGFSVGSSGNVVIYANLDIVGNTITADNNLVGNGLIVNGVSELSSIGNVKILGGTTGQVVSTDGLGNLSFIDVTLEQSPAPMPTVVDVGDTLTIPANYQGLFGYPITINGNLVVDGVLVDVNDNQIAGANGQIQFSNNGEPGASSNLTFNTSTDTLSTVNITATSNITANNFSGTFILSVLGFQKDIDATGSGNVTFTTTPYISQGTSFGTMASNGTFTFNAAGVYQVNIAYNVSDDPDGWGGINGVTGTRYNQASGPQTKNSITDVISVSVSDTYTWKVNNNVTVYGSGTTKTRMQIMRIG